jgi:hypothetical protein
VTRRNIGIAYRYWYALNGSWTTASGHTVTANNHLGSPHIGLTPVPRIDPSIDNLWTSKRARAVNCHAGCPRSPGPCGMCGFSVVLDPNEFTRLFRYRLGRQPKLGGVDSTIVAGRVRLHGAVSPTHRLLSNKLGVPESRVHAVTIESLHLPPGTDRFQEPLRARYRVPVTTN